MNGHRLKPGELRQELMKVDEAMLYYKKAETNMTFAYLSFIPGMTFMYLGKRSKTYPYNHKYGFSIAGIISLGTATYLASRYKKNMKKAVLTYNQKY